MPIMFPIALIGIFNMYIVERMSLAYYYRQPPMFDEKLNQRAIDLLQGAPILMFMVSYWALGNSQIFFNKPPIIQDHSNGAQDTDHKAFNFTTVNLTQLILIMIVFLFLDNFLYKYRHIMFRWVYLI